MKKTRNCLRITVVCLTCGFLWSPSLVFGDELFAPEYLWARDIVSKTDPVGIADTHLRIPYRDDGALDDKGNFTTFNRPGTIRPTPGLNCSGLVLSISRFLFNSNFSLSAAVRDRQGNSGSDSPMGEDWDFGLDLILNLTDGVPRRVVTPEGGDVSLADADGTTLRGFDLHDWTGWRRVLNQMRPGRVYFGSISKPTRRPGYKLLHYHVVLIIPDEKDGIWLYHATHRSNVHRMNLKTRRGLNRFMAQFRSSANNPKKILLVETVLPGSAAGRADVAEAGSGPAAGTRNADEELKFASSRAKQVLDGLGSRFVGDSRPRVSKAGSPEQKNEKEAQGPAGQAAPNPEAPPNLVVNHLSGRVFRPFPELVTHVPRFSDDGKSAIKFWFRNRGDDPRDLEILVRGPQGDQTYRERINGKTDLACNYPRDAGKSSRDPAELGRYGVRVTVDGAEWYTDLFEVAKARDAEPKITSVKVPSTVRAGSTFTLKVVARNRGAESDYGGITVSSPDPSGLRLVSAKPGRIYGRGSTVLSVTSDKIKTKVPMAERWIELWGENKAYEMSVKIRAGGPGTYPLYVRCAIRGVQVKSNVILMDPKSADTADQQGFPAYVHKVTVR